MLKSVRPKTFCEVLIYLKYKDFLYGDTETAEMNVRNISVPK